MNLMSDQACTYKRAYSSLSKAPEFYHKIPGINAERTRAKAGYLLMYHLCVCSAAFDRLSSTNVNISLSYVDVLLE